MLKDTINVDLLGMTLTVRPTAEQWQHPETGRVYDQKPGIGIRTPDGDRVRLTWLQTALLLRALSDEDISVLIADGAKQQQTELNTLLSGDVE